MERASRLGHNLGTNENGFGGQEFLGRLKSVIKITGDIESPVEPLTSWKVLK